MRSYRLDATVEQQAIVREWVGCARLVWNLALEQRCLAWALERDRTVNRCSAEQPRPDYASQCAELTSLRAEYPWLAAVPAQALQQKLRDLDVAFQRFFVGLAEHPVPKRKGKCTDSVRFPDPRHLEWQRLSKHVGHVKLPKLGLVRFRWSRQVCRASRGEQVKNATVLRKSDGWYVAFCVELPNNTVVQPNGKPAVGVDRGCIVAAATSDEELLDVQTLTHRERQRYKRLQRKMARQLKGSHRWLRTQHRIAVLAYRAAQRRADFVHQTARRLAREHGVVVVEKLRVKSMTRSARGTVEQPGKRVKQKAGLNRAILDKGWAGFYHRLAVVCPSEGSELRVVAAAYTSTRCRQCGHTDPSNRESQAVFRCRACGWREHADIHAAKNIRHLGTVGWVAPGQSAPTDGRAAAGRSGSAGSRRLRPFRRSAAGASTYGAHVSS